MGQGPPQTNFEATSAPSMADQIPNIINAGIGSVSFTISSLI